MVRKWCSLIFTALLPLLFSCGEEKKKRNIFTPIRNGHTVTNISGARYVTVASGWGKGAALPAASNAIAMVRKSKTKQTPDICLAFATSGEGIPAIHAYLRKKFPAKTRIFGGSSDSRAVVNHQNFLQIRNLGYSLKATGTTNHGIVLMTVASRRIAFGVGTADNNKSTSKRMAARKAVQMAIHNAGRSIRQKPRIVLAMFSPGKEEEAIRGIEDITGRNTVILGGTSGGPKHYVFGNTVLTNGISIAVLYTDLPIGWVYESGFKTTEKSGIVTKIKGQSILEIDNKPALEVYDSWMKGKVSRLMQSGDSDDRVKDLLTLHPLFRKYTTASGKQFCIFSHPWPDPKNRGGIATSTTIRVGERVFQSYGSWETLLNRIGNLPAEVKTKNNFSERVRPVFSFGVLCAGVMGVIPPEERKKIPHLISHAGGGAPFIAFISWGEQGHLRGIGNKHGTLSTSFLTIGERR